MSALKLFCEQLISHLICGSQTASYKQSAVVPFFFPFCIEYSSRCPKYGYIFITKLWSYPETGPDLLRSGELSTDYINSYGNYQYQKDFYSNVDKCLCNYNNKMIYFKIILHAILVFLSLKYYELVIVGPCHKSPMNSITVPGCNTMKWKGARTVKSPTPKVITLLDTGTH